MSKNPLQQANRCYRAGVGGAIIAAVCCFTLLLVATLGASGLAAVTNYLDWVLLPLLAICVIVAAYGWWRQRFRQESK